MISEYLQMIAAFSLYFCLLLSIGVYFFHKNKKESDFAVGGRQLNYWVTALSAQASDMSDWLFMAFPGLLYASGFANIWTAVGLVLFMFITWHCIAPQFRTATESTNSITLASFLQKRFNAPNNYLRILSGLICLYFFIFYIAAGLVGLGRVFEAAFQINYTAGIIIGLFITILYTLLGGLMAIAWSDLFQGIFLLGVIMLVPAYATYLLGGFNSTLQIIAQQTSDYLSLMPQNGSILATCFAIMGWGIGYFGQPHILINFMSINDVKKMKYAKYVGISWQILALTAAALVGIVGKAFIQSPLQNQEMVFIVMVKSMFMPFIAGFILCAILAATISTINTQALVSASLISHDLYYTAINTQGTEKEKLQFTRASIIIIPTIALTIAYLQPTSVLNLVLYAWSGLGSSFGPLVILSLYAHKKITPIGALSGLITGCLTAVIWPILHSSIPTLVVGFFANFIATIAISQCTKK